MQNGEWKTTTLTEIEFLSNYVRERLSSNLDLLCAWWVVEHVVSVARDRVGGSQGQSLDHRVVGNIKEKYSKEKKNHIVIRIHVIMSLV